MGLEALGKEAGQAMDRWCAGVDRAVNLMGATFVSLLTMQKFSTAGTFQYVPHANMKFLRGIITGGGGGSGGADTDGVAGSVAAAGGGGGGGTRIFLLTRAQVDAALAGGSITVTVGAGGAAGSITGGFGGAGGNATFGSLFTGNGGSGGSGTGTVVGTVCNDRFGGSSGGSSAPGGVGFSVGVLGGLGGDGAAVSANSATPAVIAVGGLGGGSYWGPGAGQLVRALASLATPVNEPGYDGTGTPGGGASGAICLNSAIGAIGGVGADGIAVLEEFA